MNFIVGELNCSEQEFSEKVKKVWKDIVEDDPFISAAQESPEGFVLGGQPQEKQRSQICFPQD